MKKKNLDSQKASELLQKLQEAVLSSSQKKETREETPDSDELAFQKKIASMLSRVTDTTPVENKPKKSGKKKSAKSNPPAQKNPPQPTPTEEPIIEEEILEEELPKEEILEEELLLPKEVIPEPIEEPAPVLEEIVEEPAIEEIPIEEPIIEAISPIEAEPIEENDFEEQAIESNLVEEAIPEEEVLEEPVEQIELTESILSEWVEEPIDNPEPAIEEALLPPPEPKKPLVRVIGPVVEPTPPPKVPTKKSPEKETPSDTIVIKPKSDLRSTTPIVIKPRRQERSPEPIKVEGNASMPRTTQKNTPPQRSGAFTPRPAQPSAAARTAKTPTASGAETRKTTPAKGKTAHRASARPAPRPLPQDEGLDVVLEHVAQDNAFASIRASEELSGADRPRGNVHALTHEELLRYVERKTGMTSDDISMILELGYDHELGRLIGSEPLRQLKTAHAHSNTPTDPATYRTAFGYRNREYTGEQSKERILAHYVKDKKALIARLAITVLLTCLLLPTTLPVLFGDPFPGIRERMPILLPLTTILILLVAGFFSRRQIQTGLQSFFRFAPTPYSVAAILYPIALLSELFNVIFVERGYGILSAALPAMAALLLTAVIDAMRLHSEMRVFRILASAKEKTVLEPAESHKQKLRHGDKIVKIVNDDIDQNLYRMHRAKHITGFFRRCNDTSSASRPFGYLLLASASLTFLVGFLCTIFAMKTAGVVSSLLLTLLFSLPLPAVLLFYYPLCRANRLLTEKGCVLVGEESVMEYAKQKTVIFRDSDMYHAKKCSQTMMREGEDFKRDLQLAGILFRKMNGALTPLCATNTADPPVTFVRLGESGTEAVIDNRYHILAGDASFLGRSGVRIPKESTDRSASRTENTSVTYIAINGVLKLTYEIEYEIAPKFEQTVSLLAENATRCAIRTYDPSLNESFLCATRGQDAEYVRVIKPGKYEHDDVSEISDSGALSLGDRFDATRPLVAANVICRIRSCGYYAQLAFSMLGTVVAAILSLHMGEMLAGIPLLLSLIFQGIGVFAAWLATHLSFRLGSAQNFK